MCEMPFEIWSVNQADEAVEKAFAAKRPIDSHHYFLIAEGFYRQAGSLGNAAWAARKAEVCRKMLTPPETCTEMSHRGDVILRRVRVTHDAARN
jgi:hypothetical protein